MNTDNQKPLHIGQISRHVRNIQVATEWYANVLGLPHLYSFGALSFFDCDGTRLFLSELAGEAPPSESILYFQVEDIESWHHKLLGLGVTFTSAPHLIHRHEDGVEEWMAFFEDCDGGMLALMSKMLPITPGT
jgi:catechol 2,3-dioxygenase-like lactoylglutathione lyase family enzyme